MSVTFALNPQVSLAETDDGAVLLHERKGLYWQLNTTGLLVLRILTRGGGLEEAAHALTARHGIPATRAHGDVAAVLAALRSADLLRENR